MDLATTTAQLADLVNSLWESVAHAERDGNHALAEQLRDQACEAEGQALAARR